MAALVVEIVFFSSQSEYFLTEPNITNIGRAMAIVGIVAAGETIVMISGGFDLSVGSTMAASGMLIGYLLQRGLGALRSPSPPRSLLGAVIGVANGSIVSYMRINPLIATLATLGIVRGLGFVISDGQEIVVRDKEILDLGTAEVGPVPLIVLIMLATFVLLGLVMPRTRYGRYTYAIGSNARASRLAGVPLHRYRIAFYVTCGTLAALGGIVSVARVGSAQPTANLGAELDVITAVILGGTQPQRRPRAADGHVPRPAADRRAQQRPDPHGRPVVLAAGREGRRAAARGVLGRAAADGRDEY